MRVSDAPDELEQAVRRGGGGGGDCLDPQARDCGGRREEHLVRRERGLRREHGGLRGYGRHGAEPALDEREGRAAGGGTSIDTSSALVARHQKIRRRTRY